MGAKGGGKGLGGAGGEHEDEDVRSVVAAGGRGDNRAGRDTKSSTARCPRRSEHADELSCGRRDVRPRVNEAAPPRGDERGVAVRRRGQRPAPRAPA